LFQIIVGGVSVELTPT